MWATKGLEAETGRLLQDVAREALAIKFRWRLSLAQRSKETGGSRRLSLASTNQTLPIIFQQLLHCGEGAPRLQQPGFHWRAAWRRGEK
ncbi:hypothetical protein ACNKHN_20510 [Shigella flexneri]